MKNLHVQTQFQFDIAARDKYSREDEVADQILAMSEGKLLSSSMSYNLKVNNDGQIQSDIYVLKGNPYPKVRKELLKLQTIESPMCKLEHIYSVCTNSLIQEIDDFWHGFNIPKEQLSVDTDTLQGLLIYVVSRLNYPQIYTEVILADLFLPKAVKKCCRTLYLEMLRAGCNFLLKMDLEPSQ
jgi:hypothetical protein